MGQQRLDERRAALGELIRRVRGSLGLTIDQAAKRAPMSPETWRKAEVGTRVKPFTMMGIERVLGWVPGSTTTYLKDGVDPEVAATRFPLPRPSTVSIDAVLQLKGHSDTVKVRLIEVIASDRDAIDAILSMDIDATEKVQLIQVYRDIHAASQAQP